MNYVELETSRKSVDDSMERDGSAAKIDSPIVTSDDEIGNNKNEQDREDDDNSSMNTASEASSAEPNNAMINSMIDFSRPNGKCVHLKKDRDGPVVRRFPSFVQAAEEFGVDRNTIRRWCLANTKQRGFWWFQKNERWKRPLEKLDMETGKVLERFDSVADVALAVGALQESILECLAGRRKSCKGYFWRYEGTDKKPPKLFCRKRPVEQLDLTTGEVIGRFESVTSAAESVGAFREGVRACLSGRANSCKGFFWRYEGADLLPHEKMTSKQLPKDDTSTTNAATATLSSSSDNKRKIKVERRLRGSQGAKKSNNLDEKQPSKKRQKVGHASTTSISKTSTQMSSPCREEKIIGERLRLLRRRDGLWYEGHVKSYNNVNNKHTVLLDEGREVEAQLSKILVEWASDSKQRKKFKLIAAKHEKLP